MLQAASADVAASRGRRGAGPELPVAARWLSAAGARGQQQQRGGGCTTSAAAHETTAPGITFNVTWLT
jgi:hypothetical protein